MKKVVISLMVGLLVVSLNGMAATNDLAPAVQASLDAAMTKYRQAKYDVSKVAFEDFIRDNQTVPQKYLAEAQMLIAYGLRAEGMAAFARPRAKDWNAVFVSKMQAARKSFLKVADYTEAAVTMRALCAYEAARSIQGDVAKQQSEYEQVLVNFPTLPDATKAKILLSVGSVQKLQGKYGDAVTTLQKVVADYPKAPADTIQGARELMAACLEKQGKLADANEVYMVLATESAWRFGAGTNSYATKMFQKVSPRLATRERYSSFLQEMLVAPKEIGPSTELLGKVKSEIKRRD
ncbi:MAG: tetratricopeptide repeat protein [Kiritimatiellae bacterium]|nr:tetratricopeptide repeat protein [Kiritimatiellia bacterium]